MNKAETIKKLGFISEEEMLLYQDVCCDNFVLPVPDSFEELLDSLQNDNDGRRKEDFEKYISDNNLLELFNKVKSMPLLNRFVEIYVYNANGLSLSTSMYEMVSNKLREAKELFDGEKEQDLKMQLRAINHSKSEYFHAMYYIKNQVRHRLSPEEELKFYEITDTATKVAYRMGEGPYKKM